jgi:hypothetical protein
MPKLDVCDRGCWCFYCKSSIRKGEHYIDIRKEAHKGLVRINICSRCLNSFTKQIIKKDIQAIETRLALKELEKDELGFIRCSDCLGFCNFGEPPDCRFGIKK